MTTINDLKQKYIEHLYDVELSRLSMLDLQTYGNAVRAADEMSKPSYAESMTTMLARIGAMNSCATRIDDKAAILDG